MKFIRKEIVGTPRNDQPFIVRYMPWFTDRICLNIIYDDFGLLHSHPWNYFTLILWGGYKEEMLVNGKVVTKNRYTGYFTYRKKTQYHAITPLKKKAITLFIRGKLESYTKFMINGSEMRDMKYWRMIGYNRQDLEKALRIE